MPAKWRITKDEYDALPEGARSLYKEAADGSGAYVLDTSDPRLQEFRDNNRRMHREIEELRKKLEGSPPKPPSDPTVSEELAALKQQLADEKKAREQASAEVARGRFESVLREVATKARVLPGAVGDVLRRAVEHGFGLNDQGAVVATDPATNEVRRGQSGSPLTLTEWLAGMKQDSGFLFARPAGANKTGAGAGGGSFKTTLHNPTPEQISENLEDIAQMKTGVVTD